jgi:hypothetical protein
MKTITYERAATKQIVNQMRLFGKKKDLIQQFNLCWKRYKALSSVKTNKNETFSITD